MKNAAALSLAALLAAVMAGAQGLNVPQELKMPSQAQPVEGAAVGTGAPMTLAGLFALKESDLDALYRNARPGPIPDGAARGLASTRPGTGWGGFTQEFFGALWQGKTFDRAKGELINRTAVGETASAKVYVGASRVDGKPSIILDYTQSGNVLARGVRDEIRELRPGLYLGIAYVKFPPLVGPYRKWLYFGLDFNPAPAPGQRDEPAATPEPQAP